MKTALKLQHIKKKNIHIFTSSIIVVKIYLKQELSFGMDRVMETFFLCGFYPEFQI